MPFRALLGAVEIYGMKIWSERINPSGLWPLPLFLKDRDSSPPEKKGPTELTEHAIESFAFTKSQFKYISNYEKENKL